MATKRVVVMLEITIGDADEKHRGPAYMGVQYVGTSSLVAAIVDHMATKKDYSNGTDYAFRMVRADIAYQQQISEN